MSERTSTSIALKIAVRLTTPILFILGVVLGGASRGGYVANAVLASFGWLIASACIFMWRDQKLTRSAMAAIAIAGFYVGVIILQLIPLPYDWWRLLPGRSFAADGLKIVGASPRQMTLSLSPQETFDALLRFGPAAAAFLLVQVLSWRQATTYICWAVLLIAAASTLIGFAQVLEGQSSKFYFYAFTNWGDPVGFMANANHQSLFLVMSLPFAAPLLARQRTISEMGDSALGQTIIVVTLVLLVTLGVMAAGSLAGYALLGPCLVLSALVLRDEETRARNRRLLIGMLGAIALLAVVVVVSPVLTDLGITDFRDDPLSRADTWRKTWRAIADVWPTGSGIGSFEALFPRYEKPEFVTDTFVNHAHNDYLEALLEMGAPAILMIAAALAWLVWRTIEIWRSESGEERQVRSAASIALGLLAIHSIVDYPLRTGAVAVFAGLCVGLMSASPKGEGRRRREAVKGQNGEASRHVEI